jgi:hypothetical protein
MRRIDGYGMLEAFEKARRHQEGAKAGDRERVCMEDDTHTGRERNQRYTEKGTLEEEVRRGAVCLASKCSTTKDHNIQMKGHACRANTSEYLPHYISRYHCKSCHVPQVYPSSIRTVAGNTQARSRR